MIDDTIIHKSIEQMKVNVVGYNLLSQKLATSDFYPECSEDALEPEHRFCKIGQFLGEEIHKGSILCLQEVSQTWGDRLHVFFHQKDYEFIYSHYGSLKSDYMGVAIAFPRKKYTMNSKKNVRLGDRITIGKKKSSSFIESINSSIRSWIPSLKSYISAIPVDQWKRARSKWNNLVMIQLTPTDSKDSNQSTFVVATYHMPCDFRNPTVMRLQARELIETHLSQLDNFSYSCY